MLTLVLLSMCGAPACAFAQSLAYRRPRSHPHTDAHMHIHDDYRHAYTTVSSTCITRAHAQVRMHPHSHICTRMHTCAHDLRYLHTHMKNAVCEDAYAHASVGAGALHTRCRHRNTRKFDLEDSADHAGRHARIRRACAHMCECGRMRVHGY
jgi:hypothetical protein